MDTKTLAVGQDVYMLSGVNIKKGEVVKVWPVGRAAGRRGAAMVEVQELDGRLYHFDIYGKGCDGNETDEGGPWEIDDEMPFAERTALLEQGAQDYEARRIEPNRHPPR